MRRRDLLGAAALVLAGAPARADDTLLLAAWRDADGGDHAGALGPDGAPRFDLALGGRAHGFARDPRAPRAVFFARRPGHVAMVADLATGRVVARVAPPEGRHFNGHGLFARDGRLLFATETDIESGDGVLGVYDVETGFAPCAAFATGGRDPHDIRMAPGGGALVVANGGILTHPDAPHANLDPDGMDPSLVHIDPRDGAICARARFPAELARVSIRHLAAIDGGTAAAMQYEGPAHDPVPLLAIQRGDGPLEALALPDALRVACRGYIGSLASDASGGVIAATSPRGNRALFWDVASGRVIADVTLPDVCAVAPSGAPGGFILGARDGLHAVDAASGAARRIAGPGRAWDNHMAATIGR